MFGVLVIVLRTNWLGLQLIIICQRFYAQFINIYTRNSFTAFVSKKTLAL